MLPVPGKKSLCRFLAKTLNTYLEVNEADIDTQIFQRHEGSIQLKDVKLRQFKYPLSKNLDHVICYLVLSSQSKINQVSLRWQWQSNSIFLDDLQLQLEGCQWQASFQYEQAGPDHPDWDPFDSTENDSDESDNKDHKKKPNFMALEWQRLKDAITTTVTESNLLQAAIQNIQDAFSLELRDVVIQLLVPLPGLDRHTLHIGWKDFRFGAFDHSDGNNNGNNKRNIKSKKAKADADFARRPGLKLMDLNIDEFFIKLMIEFPLHHKSPKNAKQRQQQPMCKKIPILEPLTWRANLRRTAGARFTLYHGYELIGLRDRHTHDDDDNPPSSFRKRSPRGIRFHQTPEGYAALYHVYELVTGVANGEPDYDYDIYQPPTTQEEEEAARRRKAPWPVTVKIVMWLLCMGGLFFVMNYFWNIINDCAIFDTFNTTQGVLVFDDRNPVLTEREESLKQKDAIKVVMSLACAAVVVLVTHYFIQLDLNTGRQERMLQKQEQEDHDEERLQQHHAIFRVPFPYMVIMNSETGVNVTLENLSLIGRVDASKLYVSVDEVRLENKRLVFAQKPSPKVTMYSIRAYYKSLKWLINIDLIHEFYIPGVIQLKKALLNSALIYQDGRLKIKLKSFSAQTLTAEEIDAGSDSAPAEMTTNGDSDRHYPKAKTSGIKGNSLNAPPNRKNEKLRRENPEFSKMNSKSEEDGKRFPLHRPKILSDSTLAFRKQIKEGIAISLEKIKIKKRRKKAKEYSDPVMREAWNRLNAEIYEHLYKLQIMASIFETIPLENHRENLRLYPNSFRGSEAVDFLLENQMADNRIQAAKFLRAMEIEFGMFESVTKEYRFRDDYHCLYRFEDPSKRRFWRKDELPYEFVETFDREAQETLIPFPITILVNRIALIKETAEDEDDEFLYANRCEFYMVNGKLSQAVDFTLHARDLRTQMVALTNGRVHGMFNPTLPKVVQRFQFSCDTLYANPELSLEDWLAYYGLKLIEEGGDSDDSDSDKDEDKSKVMIENLDEDSEPYLLPHALISEFQLKMSFSGPMVKATETSMKTAQYLGDEFTTSTDLVIHFIFNVLGKSPGMLTNLRFLGINVFESAGVATAVDVVAKFMPFGQYIALMFLASYDGVTTAIDTGKAARHDPLGNYKFGDFTRGVWHGAGEVARYGAEIRGKTDDEFYDEEDRVRLDILDFGVGAAHGIKSYAEHNTGRFVGAYVAATVTIAAAVTMGPVGGIVLGIATGALTEYTYDKAAAYVKRKATGEEEEDVEDFQDHFRADKKVY